jgi:probable addiction module antidote protein
MPEYPLYDFTAELVDVASIKIFLSEALQPGDMGYFSAALALVACCKGIDELAARVALSKAQISAALSAPDNLSSPVTCAVLRAIGLQVQQSRAS